MAKQRTVMRSKAGKKLYAVRDEKGEFTDIQTYQRAQSGDMRQTSMAELEMAAKKKKTAKKTMKAKKAAKPAATKKKKKKKVAKKKSAKRGK